MHKTLMTTAFAILVLLLGPLVRLFFLQGAPMVSTPQAPRGHMHSTRSTLAYGSHRAVVVLPSVVGASGVEEQRSAYVPRWG